MTPHDTEAERRLLAGLLREPALVGAECVRTGVSGDDLYHHAHRLVWYAAWETVAAGYTASAAGVYLVLAAASDLDELGPQPALWLADLLDADPTGAWCYDACERVKRAAIRRGVMHRAMTMLRDARDGVLATGEYERQLG